MSGGGIAWRDRLPAEDEPPGVPAGQRAAGWAVHYGRLADFERRILNLAERAAQNLSSEARGEARETIILPLQALISDLDRRQRDWAERETS